MDEQFVVCTIKTVVRKYVVFNSIPFVPKNIHTEHDLLPTGLNQD